jgi:hypothetical protein
MFKSLGVKPTLQTLVASLSHLAGGFLVGSVLVIAATRFSRAGTPSFSYPTVPQSTINELLCYMQTGDGRVLNLDRLCGSQPNGQSQLQALPQLSQDLIISELRNDNGRIVGRVVNQTGQVTDLVRVNYEVVDANGGMVENTTTYTQPPTLEPGQSATFQIMPPSGATARMTAIEWGS